MNKFGAAKEASMPHSIQHLALRPLFCMQWLIYHHLW